MTDAFILDASAILSLLKGETGAEQVMAVLTRSTVSAVNLAEVIAKLAESGGSSEKITRALTLLHLDVVAFDDQQAMTCGLLRTTTKALGLSLGDRACLALAKRTGAIALTADRAWVRLSPEVGVRVQVIR